MGGEDNSIGTIPDAKYAIENHIHQLRDSGRMGDGAKIEQQDLIPDMILTSITVMQDFGGIGWGAGAKKSYKT